MNVQCTVVTVGDRPNLVCEATCSKCGQTLSANSATDPSVRRLMAIMNRTCPRRERNFYIPQRVEFRASADVSPPASLPYPFRTGDSD